MLASLHDGLIERAQMLLRGAITAGFNNATGSSAGNLQASADDLLVDRRDDETPQEREARHIRVRALWDDVRQATGALAILPDV